MENFSLGVGGRGAKVSVWLESDELVVDKIPTLCWLKKTTKKIPVENIISVITDISDPSPPTTSSSPLKGSSYDRIPEDNDQRRGSRTSIGCFTIHHMQRCEKNHMRWLCKTLILWNADQVRQCLVSSKRSVL